MNDLCADMGCIDAKELTTSVKMKIQPRHLSDQKLTVGYDITLLKLMSSFHFLVHIIETGEK